ncbi:hypothetical protein FY557_01085 [Chryseobacterium sp. SN22]|nr:hypothetical protein FY557_01085 [Chryseobacterium sp. SN22]
MNLQNKIQAAALGPDVADTMENLLIKYRKPLMITASVILLQLIFGFDPKFCIINIIWLLV